MLISQHRFRCEKHNIFTEKVTKIALSANEDKKYNQQIQQKDMHMEREKIQQVKKKILNVTI